jgi:hypothetical protein
MKRIAFIVLASALVVGGTSLGATASSGASQAKPRLGLVDTDPLTVRGVNFKAGEQITVTATMRNQAKTHRLNRAARTTAQGGFTVTLAGVDFNDCALIAVTAQGGSGDKASLKLPPRQCGALG